MNFIDLCDSPDTADLSDDVVFIDTAEDNVKVVQSRVFEYVEEYEQPPSSTWQPFYLNSLLSEAVASNARANNNNCCLNIDDIIFSGEEVISNVVILTYEIDPGWLLNSVPLLMCLPLLVLHGGTKKIEGIDLGNVTMSPIDMGTERYGTHHNKIIFVFYRTGLRVAITTANFTETDWKYKIQGVFVQDFPYKESPSSSEFECSLLAHCSRIIPLGRTAQQQWKDTVQQLKQYDYSSAEVILISSVPGRHSGPTRNKWGQWKLRDELSKLKSTTGDCDNDNADKNDYSNGNSSSGKNKSNDDNSNNTKNNNDQRIVMQFSSIGSLKSNESFIDELSQSMAPLPVNFDFEENPKKKQKKDKNENNKIKIEIIWPTVDTVRGSVQGWGSGFSMPCDEKNMFINDRSQIVKEGLASRLHRWNSFNSGRGIFTPHLKCYFSYNIHHKKRIKENNTLLSGGKHNKFDYNNDIHDDTNTNVNYNTNDIKKEIKNESNEYNNESENDSVVELNWFLLTSANLSQAAWGVSEKAGTQLYVKSYEIGVLFLPERIKTMRRLFSCTPTHRILGIDLESTLKSRTAPSSSSRTTCRYSGPSSHSSSGFNSSSQPNSKSSFENSSGYDSRIGSSSCPSSSTNRNDSSSDLQRTIFAMADCRATTQGTSLGPSLGPCKNISNNQKSDNYRNDSELINKIYFPIPFKVPPDPYDFKTKSVEKQEGNYFNMGKDQNKNNNFNNQNSNNSSNNNSNNNSNKSNNSNSSDNSNNSNNYSNNNKNNFNNNNNSDENIRIELGDSPWVWNRSYTVLRDRFNRTLQEYKMQQQMQ